MNEWLDEVELETRTIGALVLTTPFLQRLGWREIVNRHCPVAEQAELDHGLVAELTVQCRLTEPQALYDMVDWAERYQVAALYEELSGPEQLNDDRVGRMLEAIWEQRAKLWGELIGTAAREYGLDLRRLHADCKAVTLSGQ